ncbi:MAG: glucose-6-phosphate isomerase [Bdellovibrionales bacterium]
MYSLQNTKEWHSLEEYQRKFAKTLAALFQDEPDRTNAWRFSCGPLCVDFSTTHLTEELRDLLCRLAQARDIEAWRDQMFDGACINSSENRAVLHTALRAKTGTITVDGDNVIPLIHNERKKIKEFVEAVHSGTWRGASGKKIEHIINIGIGGSDLGARLAVEALSTYHKGLNVHFVANVDAAEINKALSLCNPETTLFVIVSKTFATQETLLNAARAKAWLVEALGEHAIAHHFVAVSTNQEAIKEFGITRSFAMWDWVGGRYSLWSSAGLSLALAVGYEAFQDMLDGAAKMDAHFRTAPLHQNIPVLMALMSVWCLNFEGFLGTAVLPYSERLHDLPRYVQQLDMESNGKSVTRDGDKIDYTTGGIVFGGCGTVSQHSFHQWLHQGTFRVLSIFIGTREDDLNQPEAHQILTLHREAQIKALAFGEKTSDPARTNEGNRPALSLTLAQHNPENLGLLLALFEHSVFTQGVIWGINSFDQFGVELGKKLVINAMRKPL